MEILHVQMGTAMYPQPRVDELTFRFRQPVGAARHVSRVAVFRSDRPTSTPVSDGALTTIEQ